MVLDAPVPWSPRHAERLLGRALPLLVRVEALAALCRSHHHRDAPQMRLEDYASVWVVAQGHGGLPRTDPEAWHWFQDQIANGASATLFGTEVAAVF